MLKLEQIMTAINTKLIDKFGIEINENDVKKGFNRPSFFVKFEDIYKTDYIYNFERGLTVRIYYFPSDRYKYQLEVLEVQQEIENLFKIGFVVEDRHLTIREGIESDVIDGVLEVSFGLSFMDSDYEETEKVKMGVLNFDARN